MCLQTVTILELELDAILGVSGCRIRVVPRGLGGSLEEFSWEYQRCTRAAEVACCSKSIRTPIGSERLVALNLKVLRQLSQSRKHALDGPAQEFLTRALRLSGLPFRVFLESHSERKSLNHIRALKRYVSSIIAKW